MTQGTSTIRSLQVALKARTKKFSRAMKNARKSVTRFKNAIPGANLLLSKFGAGLTLGGFGFFLNRSSKSVDALGKLSDRLGIATQKIQAYERSASLAGLAQGDLHKGLQMLARRMGEAKEGTGEGVSALKLLNLHSEEFLQLGLAEQFEQITDRIAGLKTQQEKAAVAADLFGRSGVQLVNLLQQGRGTFAESEAFIRRFGLSLTRLDASRVEASRDAIDDLRRVASLTFDRLTVELAPLITAASKKLIDLGKDGEVNLGQKMIAAIQKVAGGVAWLVDAFSKAILHVRLFVARARVGFEKVRESALKASQKILSAFGRNNPELNQSLKESRAHYRNLGAEVSRIEVKLRKYKAGVVGASSALKKFLKDVNDEADRHAKILENEAKKKREALGTGDSGQTLSRPIGDGYGITRLTSQTTRLEQVSSSMASTFVSGLQEIIRSADDLASVLKNLSLRLLETVTQATVFDPLSKSIATQLGGLFNSISGSAVGAGVGAIDPGGQNVIATVSAQTINDGIQSSSDLQASIRGFSGVSTSIF